MKTIYWLYNDWLLWLVQELFYGYWPFSIVVMCVLLICLPSHRRSALVLTGAAVFWSLMCLGLYNALEEAPALSWFMIGALSYRLMRWVLWRLPPGSPSGVAVQGPAWLRLRAAWATPIIREYFSMDPRGVYWLDLARAVRGLPLSRSSADRQQALFPARALPPGRQPLWNATLRLVEWRIWLYRRLPSYWHRPHARIDLDEPHVRGILEDVSKVVFHRMLRCWTGNDFPDYCGRDPATHRRELMNAAFYGQKYCLHRSALAEYLTFRTPWRKGDTSLIHAAYYCYETWRQRRQYDMLWAEEKQRRNDLSDDPKTGVKGVANKSNNDPSVAQEQPEEPQDQESEEIRELESSESEEPSEAGVIDLSEGLGGAEDSPGEAKEIGNDLASRNDFSDDEMFSIESDEEEMSDAPSSGAVKTRVTGMPEQQQHRLRDLTTACRMLGAFLGVPSVMEFGLDVETVERRLASSNTRLAALMLLMLYCLRRDFSGADVDQRKFELMIKLGERFGRGSDDKQARETRRLYHMMQVDLHMERGEYSQVREYFSRREELSQYERKILADAEASMACHLTGQSELRDMLRYDAICHYFEAGFCGLWTVEYAHLLIDKIGSTDDLWALLRDHPTDVTAPRTLPLGDKKRRKLKKKVAGSSIDKVVLRFYSVRSPQKPIPRTITELPCTIGRSKKHTDLSLDVAGVMDVHVCLTQHSDGLLVTDVSKSAGIRVNDGPSVPQAILQQGDRFQFGNVVVQVASIVRRAA
ncbi:MAG: FHA domain-containing protein [Pirellulaceae bacterium]